MKALEGTEIDKIRNITEEAHLNKWEEGQNEEAEAAVFEETEDRVEMNKFLQKIESYSWPTLKAKYDIKLIKVP